MCVIWNTWDLRERNELYSCLAGKKRRRRVCLFQSSLESSAVSLTNVCFPASLKTSASCVRTHCSSVFTAVWYALHACIFWSCTVLLTLRQINIWCPAKLCCHVSKKHMGMTHLKIRGGGFIESIFDGNSTLLSMKCWCLFSLNFLHTENTASCVAACSSWSASLSNPVLWSGCPHPTPTHRSLGCRRRCSEGSRTSGWLRDRSPLWRRRRTSCWRSWMPPGPDWGRPVTCWLLCRSPWTITLFFLCFWGHILYSYQLKSEWF